MYAAAKSAYR